MAWYGVNALNRGSLGATDNMRDAVMVADAYAYGAAHGGGFKWAFPTISEDRTTRTYRNEKGAIIAIVCITNYGEDMGSRHG